MTTCSLATTCDMIIAVFANDNCAYPHNCLETGNGDVASDDAACFLTSQGGMQHLSGTSTVSWDSVQGKRYKLVVSTNYRHKDGTFGITANST